MLLSTNLMDDPNWRVHGEIHRLEHLSGMALDFQNNTTNIDWEKSYKDGFMLYKDNEGTLKLEGIDWEEYIIEFGKYKINRL